MKRLNGLLCLVFAGLFAQAALAANARDVGPETGILFSPFLFGHNGEILGNSNRGGTFTTQSRGQEWNRAMDGALTTDGTEAFNFIVCQAPSARGTLYSATIAEGLFRTDDFARRWTALAPLPDPRLAGCAVDPADPEVVYALTAGLDSAFQLFKSTDGGKSFAVVGGGLPALDVPFAVAVAPTSPQRVYVTDAGTFQGVYVSEDGGLSFTRIATAPDFPTGTFLHPTNDGVLFVSADALYRSLDGGATFVKVLDGFVNDLQFDPLDPSAVYVAQNTSGLFVSHDAGATFSTFGNLSPEQLGVLGATAVGVQVTGRKRTFYANTSVGNFRSDDGGQTFSGIERGYRGAQVDDVTFDSRGRLLVAAINSRGVFRETRRGSYEPIGASIPGDPQRLVSAIAASPADPDTYLIETIGGIFLSHDGGASWSFSGGPGTGNAGRITFAPGDATRAYAVGSVSGLFRSADGGASFTRTPAVQLGSVAVHPTDANVVYLGSWAANRGVFKSIDGGVTLRSTGLTTGNFTALAIDPANPQIVYAGHRSGSVFRSADGGVTFAPAGAGLAGAGVMGLAIDPGNPTRLYAWMHAGGLFRSDDGASTWTAVDTGESLRRSGLSAGRGALAIDPTAPGHVFLGNRGVIQIDDER